MKQLVLAASFTTLIHNAPLSTLHAQTIERTWNQPQRQNTQQRNTRDQGSGFSVGGSFRIEGEGSLEPCPLPPPPPPPCDVPPPPPVVPEYVAPQPLQPQPSTVPQHNIPVYHDAVMSGGGGSNVGVELGWFSRFSDQWAFHGVTLSIPNLKFGGFFILEMMFGLTFGTRGSDQHFDSPVHLKTKFLLIQNDVFSPLIVLGGGFDFNGLVTPSSKAYSGQKDFIYAEAFAGAGAEVTLSENWDAQLVGHFFMRENLSGQDIGSSGLYSNTSFGFSFSLSFGVTADIR